MGDFVLGCRGTFALSFTNLLIHQKSKSPTSSFFFASSEKLAYLCRGFGWIMALISQSFLIALAKIKLFCFISTTK